MCCSEMEETKNSTQPLLVGFPKFPGDLTLTFIQNIYAYLTKYKTNHKKACIMITNQITMDWAAVLELSHLFKNI